jgi:hypothetical protein
LQINGVHWMDPGNLRNYPRLKLKQQKHSHKFPAQPGHKKKSTQNFKCRVKKLLNLEMVHALTFPIKKKLIILK